VVPINCITFPRSVLKRVHREKKVEPRAVRGEEERSDHDGYGGLKKLSLFLASLAPCHSLEQESRFSSFSHQRLTIYHPQCRVFSFCLSISFTNNHPQQPNYHS
jgi:hypothetical protein